MYFLLCSLNVCVLLNKVMMVMIMMMMMMMMNSNVLSVQQSDVV